MAKVYFILAFVLQASLIYANDIEVEDNEVPSRDTLKLKPGLEEDIEDVKDKKDWIDMFLMPTSSNMYPSSSAALMASATNSNKSAEEQLEDIKEMADKIRLAIQSEMANLLSYALIHCEKNHENEKNENVLRKKRETSMDSSQLIMRLLKHIKSNNEYQNIAIEKMMSAQEIADKFGIDFTPDTDVLSDLAVAANEQAKEMTLILKDACDLKNVTKKIAKEEVEVVPFDSCEKPLTENNTYYVYSVQHPEQEMFAQQPFPTHEYTPEHYVHSPPVNHHGHQYNHHQHEHQMPHHMTPPVTPKPNFYDSVMAYTPDYYPYTCPMEPVTTTTTIVLPTEEVVQPEPELVGEEYEETVSSKMYVSRDEEPGSATVNHVMTYTLSEKAHFKKPEIEKLPQQMQYTFFLM